MAKLNKVRLVGDGKRITLTDHSLHWYRTGRDKRLKVHVYQHPNPIDPRMSHSMTLCGIQIATSQIGKLVEINSFDMCATCLGVLRREFQGSFEEVSV